MRAVALHNDVIVFVSDFMQTTSSAVRGGDEGFLIDSVVYPEELRALTEVLEQAGYPVSGLLTTHGDWDHLLGRLAYPGAALGAAESTVARLSSELGDAQRRLRSFDEEQYVPDRAPLALGSLQGLPTPGRLEIGTRAPVAEAEGAGGGADGGADAPGEAHELEVMPAEGHTADGAFYWLPWASVLICGDYLSPVEIPMISRGGSLERYRATLARLSAYVERAEWVVPGHGAPQSGERAREILREDDEYLAALSADASSADLGAIGERGRTEPQRRIHEANVVAASAGPA